MANQPSVVDSSVQEQERAVGILTNGRPVAVLAASIESQVQAPAIITVPQMSVLAHYGEPSHFSYAKSMEEEARSRRY